MHPSQQQPAYRPDPPLCITLTRNGRTRSYKVRRLAATLVVGGFAAFSAVYFAATAYLIYRDDLLGGTLNRQVAMQFDYEDRIAALRSEIDRVSSRHAVVTQSVDGMLSTLLERQADIESRHVDLGALVGRTRAAGIDVALAAPAGDQIGAGGERPESAEPASEPPPLSYAPAEPAADAMITGALMNERGAAAKADTAALKPLLARIGSDLDAAEERQSAFLDVLETAADDKAARLSAALTPLGIEIEETGRAPRGGPFIAAAPLHFVERSVLLNRTLDDIAALRRGADGLPLRRPVGSARVTSGFGYRSDPFLNRRALHAGIDFAAASGSEVRATASGVVATAGWSGGYGQLIEIRHAGGVTTRYGHLSAVLVAPGAKVAAGALIGRVGSTGRSTGPHLHYETRRDGEPVNPSRYLTAGLAL